MIISEKVKFSSDEKVLVECDFKASDKCRNQYLKCYKNILKGRLNNDGKDRCQYCFNSLTKIGSQNFNFKNPKIEDYFSNIDTELKAYLLGFIAGDGHIKKDGLHLENHESDKEILELFRDNISPSSNITKRKDERGKNTLCLKIFSVNIVKDLLRHLKLENPGNKCDKIILPNLSKELIWPFLRGLLDSDGHVSSKSTKSPRSSIGSISTIILNDIGKLCQDNDITFNITKTQIIFGGVSCIKFLNLIYKDANFYLNRKYDLWKYWLTWVPYHGTSDKPRKVRKYYPPISEEHKEKIRESNRTRKGRQYVRN